MFCHINEKTRALYPNREVMVYGYKGCEYIPIMRGFKIDGFTVYHSSLGNEYEPIPKTFIASPKVISGSDLIISTDRDRSVARECKAGLTNLVIQNCRRYLAGMPLIPVVFCISIDSPIVSYPETTAKTMLERSQKYIITHAELRRAYKLCHDPRIDRQIRSIAQQTFCSFVRVHCNTDEDGDTVYSLEPIPAPWNSPGFAQELRNREATPKIVTLPKPLEDWRDQLNASLPRANAPRLSACHCAIL